MNPPASVLERLRSALTTPDNGVLGLADQLLRASLEHDLQLDWRNGNCRLSTSGAVIEVPTQKAVVRALLARIAALCNARSPNSVSPYGGRAEVSLEDDPARVIRVAFVNTPERLDLELSTERADRPVPGDAPPASVGGNGRRLSSNSSSPANPIHHEPT